MSNLKEKYNKEVVPALEQKLGTTNRMLVPRLMKVVLNMAFGIVSKDEQKNLMGDLAAITGQKPKVCKAKKSISNFKLREGMVIGAKVTLRGERMWEFADRLISAALPRIRDFRGVSNRGFDGRGNYTLGIKEHTIFPELVESSAHSGMDITFVTSSTDNKAAKELLVSMGMPFAGRN
jgi:large subunit ribosomal protein L5